MKISERLATGLISGTLGFIIFSLIQFMLAVRVFPKYANEDIFMDIRYGASFGLTLFLVGFLLGSERMAYLLGGLFRTNRK